MINLSSFIAFHARRTPGRPALRYRGEDISYASFDERIRKVGGWLRSQGIGEDDVVAVLMKSSAAFLELTFATSHIGAVFLPINYRLSRDEVGADHCRSRLAGFKVPKQLIMRDSLPRNPSGKVLKRVLRAELEANV
jgi:fatty-acyl-CoA synthase